ncbi:hypothetical protein R6Q59_001606 [Mikania micrantha]
MGVDPIPNAFVVNLGYQLEVISNGRLKSVEHRGILNSTTSRTSIVTFFGPNPELPIIVEPAKELVTSSNPQMFKAYRYNEFIANYLASWPWPTPVDKVLIKDLHWNLTGFIPKLILFNNFV